MNSVVLKVSVRDVERELFVQPCFIESVSYFADDRTIIGMASGATHLILGSQEEVRKQLGIKKKGDYIERYTEGPGAGLAS